MEATIRYYIVVILGVKFSFVLLGCVPLGLGP